MRLLYDSNGVPRVIEGSGNSVAGTVGLGPGFAGTQTSAVSVINPHGGGVSAWPSADAQGDPAVGVREDFPDGAVQTALVSGGAGGEVGELAVGRSGLGDGLVAFRQGSLGNAAIVAAQITAPPVAPLETVPQSWVRASQAKVSWQPAVSADGPLTYTVVLDGRRLATPTGTFTMRISSRGLSSGVHRVQVLASDINGQATLSPPAELRIDDTPPKVTVRRVGRGRSVRVLIHDSGAGVAPGTVIVSFGDGRSAAGREELTHRYAHAGEYRITVRARDMLGNATAVRLWVRVR